MKFKKAYVIIVSVLICLVFASLKQFYLNNDQIQYIGTSSDTYVEVVIKNRAELNQLIDLSKRDKLNISRKINGDETTIYLNNNFDAYPITNNSYEKNIKFDVTYKNIIFDVFKYRQLSDINDVDIIGSYKVISKEIEAAQLDKEINAKGFVSYYAEQRQVTDISNYFNYVIVIVCLIVTSSLIVNTLLNHKSIAVLKLYSSNLKIFRYLFLGPLLLYITTTIIAATLGYYLLNVTNINILINYLLVPLLVYMIVVLLLYLFVANNSSLQYLKGKVNYKLIMMFYKTAIIVVLIAITLSVYIILGEANDDLDKTLSKSNWDISRDYARLQLRFEIVDVDNKVNLIQKYNTLEENGSIYLNNDVFENAETAEPGSVMENDIKKEMSRYPGIDVNENYLSYVNMDKQNVSKAGALILIPKKKMVYKDDILKDYCSYDNNDDRQIKIKDCRYKQIEDKEYFVNANVDEHKDGLYDSPIIRVIGADIITDKMTTLENYLLIKIDRNKTLNQNFDAIKKLINNLEIVSENGAYNNIESVYSINEDTLNIIKNFKQTLAVFLGIMFIIINFFIVTIVQLFISASAITIMIKKISGYSLIQRYNGLFNFLITSFIITNIVTVAIITILKIGFVDYKFYVFLTSTYIISILITIFNIERFEKKRIMNILKGEEY